MPANRSGLRRLLAKEKIETEASNQPEVPRRTRNATRCTGPASSSDANDRPEKSSLPASRQPKITNQRPTDVEDANIPMALVDTYTPFLTRVTQRTKDALGSLKEFRRWSQHTAKKWRDSVPVFTIDICINDLLKRGKNTNAGKVEANTKIKSMKNARADASSMLVMDKGSHLLVAVFSQRHRAPDKGPKTLQPQPYPGPRGRTLRDYAKASKHDPRSVVHNGLDPTALEHYHEATQNLHSVLKPNTHARDLRHPEENIMAYREDERNGMDIPQPGNDHVEFTVVDNGEVKYERTGVSHLVHCWAQKGHPHETLTPSKDMVRSCSSAMAVNQYFEATKPTAHKIDDCFKASFPDDHAKYSKAYSAGQWLESDPGPFLGRALVWKLQVQAHQDGLDEGGETSHVDDRGHNSLESSDERPRHHFLLWSLPGWRALFAQPEP
ncbi:hypothetical protein BKA70DRAFT_1232481 [Coprinopsis sp. MPI-PUGE-AT-0042]|nr:hypothetical protein BKA70DRAFT_1232481 [Coprinopsis sp. MPI-PUGE-AT-0042]